MSTKQPHLDQSEIIESLPLACADETAARAFIEAQRWGGTPCCPHCGDVNVYRMTGPSAEKRGLLRCRGCKRQFTVRVGTVFEDSKFSLSLWCKAFWETATCKNGISALELSRKLQVSYKSAHFMLTRIRYAMEHGTDAPKLSGTIEADETYVGGRPTKPWKGDKGGRSAARKTRAKWSEKIPVFAVVERGGEVRAEVMPSITSANLKDALLRYADPSSRLMTDERRGYEQVGKPFAEHGTVRHGMKEYKRFGTDYCTNTVEGFFARLKRKINGTHHAVSPAHLHRYVSETAFVYNTRGLNDGERVARLVRECNGKRIMYKQAV